MFAGPKINLSSSTPCCEPISSQESPTSRADEAGSLPVTRIGRRLYFRRSELERVFQAKDLMMPKQEFPPESR